MTSLVFQGKRRVIGIALPKGKPDSPMRNVELELQGTEKYPFSGWIFADKLGDIAIGDLVACIIEKSDEGYKNVTSIQKVSGDLDGHTPEVASGGGDRAVNPADRSSEAPTARDTQHDSYAYLAACGMVDLAYEELQDGLRRSLEGDIEHDMAVTPALVKDVAGRLLAAADAAQRELIGRTDRQAMSHTRARGAVRTVVSTNHRVADSMQWRNAELELTEEWDAKVAKAAITLLKIAETI